MWLITSGAMMWAGQDRCVGKKVVDGNLGIREAFMCEKLRISGYQHATQSLAFTSEGKLAKVIM